MPERANVFFHVSMMNPAGPTKLVSRELLRLCQRLLLSVREILSYCRDFFAIQQRRFRRESGEQPLPLPPSRRGRRGTKTLGAPIGR